MVRSIMKNYRMFLGTLYFKLHMLCAAPLYSPVFFLKDSQNFFIQSLPLYTSCLFSILLNEDIVDIKKFDEICSLTFFVDEFSGLFLHPSIFSIKH